MKTPLNLRSVAAAIDAGELRPTQLLQECLKRIDANEQGVRAWWLSTVSGRLKRQSNATRTLTRESASDHCTAFRVGIKDIVDVAGLPTRAGSSLTSEPASTNAPVVAALRRAQGRAC